jgi:hypothetical protein
LKWIGAGVVVGVVLGAGTLAVLVEREIIGWPIAPAPQAIAVPPLNWTFPEPSPAERAFSRAQDMHARGKLRDALATLETISDGDPIRGQADELKATIEQQLQGRVRPRSTPRGPSRRP